MMLEPRVVCILLVIAVNTAACGSHGRSASLSPTTPTAATEGRPANANASVTVESTPTAEPNVTPGGIQQNGNGWVGNINVAATSAQYEGMSLDQLLMSGSELGRELAKVPAVEAAIRSVSAATGVPAGLLAGVAYQESNFDVAAVSGNPNPTPGDTQDVGLVQCPAGDFAGTAWQDPATNLTDFAVKYFLPSYKHYQSWGAALRAWNSGDDQVHLTNLQQENNNTDANYVTEVLAKHCMGLD